MMEAVLATLCSVVRDETLREIKATLEPLLDGTEIYQSMVDGPNDEWGTVPGRQYSVGVTDEGVYRSVMAWAVEEDGSVRLLKVGKLSSP